MNNVPVPAAQPAAIPPAAEESVKERLLRAAAEVFARKGYAATSVHEIVEAAGVTKPVLYYYFHSKEGIYLTILNEALKLFTATVQSAETDKGPATARLKGMLDRLYALVIDNLQIARLIYSIYYGPPQGAPVFDFEVLHTQLQKAVLELVKLGVATGEFRPGNMEQMAWAVLGAFNICTELQVCHIGTAPGREGLAPILDLLFMGICEEKTHA